MSDFVTSDIEWAMISIRFMIGDDEFHYMWDADDESWNFCNHWVGLNGNLLLL